MSRIEVTQSLLPVHGFVLAGGQSSRMGRDKALLAFRGRPLVEIAIAKLRSFCAEVSIVGNREDLRGFAPVVFEARRDAGPVAGIEAGLEACKEPWALFVPVDVPLVPAAFLRRWTELHLQKAKTGCGGSYPVNDGIEQPAFCLLKQTCFQVVQEIVNGGERRLRNLLWTLERVEGGGWLWICKVEEEAGTLLHPEHPHMQLRNWFRNLNTPEELMDAEAGFGPE